jgi:AcrR family transcriptional regulator
MGIAERRERERERRRRDILLAAWEVAEDVGWPRFSVEQVAARAELGRATVYGYFESLDALLVAMAEEAFSALSGRLAAAPGIAEALDVPVRLAQANPAAFELLLSGGGDPPTPFSGEALRAVRERARQLIGRVERLAKTHSASLPPDAKSAAAFVAAISLAGAVVPELRASTTLRHRWHDFCLSQKQAETDDESGGRSD